MMTCRITTPLILLILAHYASAVYFTELNWYADPSGFYQSSNPGAYFKIGFTGTQLHATLDQSGVPTQPYMDLKWTVDNAPWQTVRLPAASNDLVLASGLASGNHTVVGYVMRSLQSVDRWIPQCKVKITGLTTDGTLFTPTLRPNRMLVYWDSIGEGVRVLGSHPDVEDLVDNDSTETWAMALAAALDAELSSVSYGRLGYVTEGNGNVPPLFTPGNDDASSWNKFDATHSRLNASGLFNPEPDFIFCGHGTNDGNNPAVTASALGWMTAVRQAAPRAHVFVTIPFGGFAASYIQAAFTKYQSATPDARMYLMNLGPEAQAGLTAFVNGGSAQSGDGLHPLAWRDGQLGAMMAVQAQLLMASSS